MTSAGHPLLGRRMPDLDLVTANGPLRVFALLHEARPVAASNLGETGGLDIAHGRIRVKLIDAQYAGPWEAPGPSARSGSRRRVDPARRIRGWGRSNR